jgi:hypothetical protein
MPEKHDRHAPSSALPPLKRRIVSVITPAGREGITAADLFGIIYGNELPPLPSRKVLKSHAWQLRRLGFPIKGKSGGAKGSVYRWAP